MAPKTEQGLRTDQLFVNLGPQHPSTHGVLRVALTLEGEVILRAEPDVGYLHRGSEKLAEIRNYHQLVVLSDRWDYVSATNGMGFHAPQESMRLLGEAANLAQKARLEATRLLARLGVTAAPQYPDMSTRQAAWDVVQAFIKGEGPKLLP